jgi:hypothetical protein
MWRFSRLDRLGQVKVRIEGSPHLSRTPKGPVVVFDGIKDAMMVPRHPLAGARAFTFEAVFRPDGGAFAQRWFHLAQGAEEAGQPIARLPRIMFELRVVGQNWYLDSFMTGPGYNQTLVNPAKLHPLGRWYHVAQTYDGTTYRSYVDGVLEGEAVTPFVAQRAGISSVGTRINRVDYFHGAIYAARFSARARGPASFMRVPHQLRQEPVSNGAVAEQQRRAAE